MRAETPKFLVVRDTREKEGQGWQFAPSKNSAGTVVRTLKTGDYTIEGHEDTLCIERKGSVAEIAGNVYQARFERELERMASFRHAFVICEFSLADVIAYPEGAGLPERAKSRTRLTGYSILRRLTQLQLAFPSIHWVWAGDRGRAFAASLFKRVVERVV